MLPTATLILTYLEWQLQTPIPWSNTVSGGQPAVPQPIPQPIARIASLVLPPTTPTHSEQTFGPITTPWTLTDLHLILSAQPDPQTFFDLIICNQPRVSTQNEKHGRSIFNRLPPYGAPPQTPQPTGIPISSLTLLLHLPPQTNASTVNASIKPQFAGDPGAFQQPMYPQGSTIRLTLDTYQSP